MSLQRFAASALISAAMTAVLPAARAVEDLVVIDFTHVSQAPGEEPTRAYDYAWNDWDNPRKLTQLPGKGLLINHLSGKGTLGEDRGLDFRKHGKARLILMVGNGNAATSLGFNLADKDGTEATWDIPLADLTKGALLAITLDLTKPSRIEKPGKVAGLDLKKLRTWQLRGNYQDAAVEVLIAKVVAVAE